MSLTCILAAETMTHRAHDPVEAGIIPSTSGARPWHWTTTLVGSLIGLLVAIVSFPVLIAIALLSTALEATRDSFGLDAAEHQNDGVRDDDVVLVLPGTCTFAFWQMGMLQYVCERFDTKSAKLIGVSSGALCSCFLFALEQAADAGKSSSAALRVRLRAQELFALVDKKCAPVVWWPLGFLARLGSVIDAIGSEALPEDCVARAAGRLRVGFRRLSGAGLPALVPDMLCDFSTRAELLAAVKTSSHVGMIVRPTPLTYLPGAQALCCDGVNPYSFYCFIDFLQQHWQGLVRWTAPAHTYAGLDVIYAIWNCGAMRVMLPRLGQHIWVTPTVRNKLDLRYILRVSSWYIAEQWRSGYAHARQLDLHGYWDALPRRS